MRPRLWDIAYAHNTAVRRRSIVHGDSANHSRCVEGFLLRALAPYCAIPLMVHVPAPMDVGTSCHEALFVISPMTFFPSGLRGLLQHISGIDASGITWSGVSKLWKVQSRYSSTECTAKPASAEYSMHWRKSKEFRSSALRSVRHGSPSTPQIRLLRLPNKSLRRSIASASRRA